MSINANETLSVQHVLSPFKIIKKPSTLTPVSNATRIKIASLLKAPVKSSYTVTDFNISPNTPTSPPEKHLFIQDALSKLTREKDRFMRYLENECDNIYNIQSLEKLMPTIENTITLFKSDLDSLYSQFSEQELEASDSIILASKPLTYSDIFKECITTIAHHCHIFQGSLPIIDNYQMIPKLVVQSKNELTLCEILHILILSIGNLPTFIRHKANSTLTLTQLLPDTLNRRLFMDTFFETLILQKLRDHYDFDLQDRLLFIEPNHETPGYVHVKNKASLKKVEIPSDLVPLVKRILATQLSLKDTLKIPILMDPHVETLCARYPLTPHTVELDSTLTPSYIKCTRSNGPSSSSYTISLSDPAFGSLNTDISNLVEPAIQGVLVGIKDAIAPISTPLFSTFSNPDFVVESEQLLSSIIREEFIKLMSPDYTQSVLSHLDQLFPPASYTAHPDSDYSKLFTIQSHLKRSLETLKITPDIAPNPVQLQELAEQCIIDELHRHNVVFSHISGISLSYEKITQFMCDNVPFRTFFTQKNLPFSASTFLIMTNSQLKSRLDHSNAAHPLDNMAQQKQLTQYLLHVEEILNGSTDKLTSSEDWINTLFELIQNNIPMDRWPKIEPDSYQESEISESLT